MQSWEPWKMWTLERKSILLIESSGLLTHELHRNRVAPRPCHFPYLLCPMFVPPEWMWPLWLPQIIHITSTKGAEKYIKKQIWFTAHTKERRRNFWGKSGKSSKGPRVKVDGKEEKCQKKKENLLKIGARGKNIYSGCLRRGVKCWLASPSSEGKCYKVYLAYLSCG